MDVSSASCASSVSSTNAPSALPTAIDGIPTPLTRTNRFARDERWSETGDRYIVKLFRDFVFHQMDESGKPVVSLSHILLHLNKVSTLGHTLRQRVQADAGELRLGDSSTQDRRRRLCWSRGTRRVALL